MSKAENSKTDIDKLDLKNTNEIDMTKLSISNRNEIDISKLSINNRSDIGTAKLDVNNANEIDITKLDLTNIDEKEFYENLQDILKTARIEQNISQKQVANKLGFTQQQYQKYETGTNRIPAIQALKIANYLDLSINDVIGGAIIRTVKGIETKPVNENTVIYNSYNYHNGFFSNFFNMDLNFMKNKVALSAIILSIIIYFSINILKFFPAINATYNPILLQTQTSAFMIAFAITIFVVFGYTIISYIFGYIAFYFFTCLLFRIYAFGSTNYVYLNDMLLKAGMQLSCLVLTIITFYVLKKLRVNINVAKQKVEVEVEA